MLSRWLLEGAPAGFALPIPPGPYFPPASDPEGAAIEDMLAAEKSHPTCYACYGEKVSLGMKQALKYVKKGFAKLYRNTRAAEEVWGKHTRPHSATSAN